MELYPIVIVGGSIAGLSCSLYTSYRTLIIEKKREIGKPVVCGEYVPLLFTHYADIPSPLIARKIEGMVTYLDDERIERRWPGAILNRDEWEKSLYIRARKRGVEFLLNTRVLELKGDILTLETGMEIRAKVIIGADGPLSIVGKAMKSQNKRFIYGYQYKVPLRRELNLTEVYINREFKGGYGWLFPKGETANVGIGVKGVKEPWKILDNFLDRLYEKVEKRILDRVAGPIPVGGILKDLVSENALLTGDAGGFTNPITGAGIYQAFWTGRLAAECANNYLKGNKKALERYEEEAKRFWESQIERDKKKREILEKGWGEDFKTLIHRTWIAFDEYYYP